LARANLKTRLAVMPASASAPAITSNSICIEADCRSCDESAAATGVTVGFGAVAALGCGFAGGSAAARRGLSEALLTPEESGQRDATDDDDAGAVVSGAVALGLFGRVAVGAAAPARGSAVTLVSSTRICGAVSSARASAIDLRASKLDGGAGLAVADDGAACDGGGDVESGAAARAILLLSALSVSARLYQHWRLEGCSMR
jgi:hypothetical protein